jgi:hypothetical protein
MKISKTRAGKSGYISYMLVLSVGMVLTLLTVYYYRSSMNAHAMQSSVQLRADYGEKEEAILRSIVAITPNRAIRAMQNNSNSTTTISDPLRWQNIFTEALVLANARTSISSSLQTSLNISNLKMANMGDSALGTPSLIFKAVSPDTGYMSVGINRSLGTGFPPPLTTSNTTTTSRDSLYPIISADKQYGTLAQSYLNSATLNGTGTTAYGLDAANYPRFNRLAYPKINFGYAKPGDPFVAKRNWWAFSMNVMEHDKATTLLSRPARDMVLSIYEIPSQLAISASSFMSLGQYASGEAWQNVTIGGGVFAGKAAVVGNTTLPALASRRGMTLSSGTTVGGQSFTSSPFTPGVREAYQLTQGEFFPVSLASESGKVAFIPINRGVNFFDRLTHPTEATTVSPTTWNDYSVGALQCAMRLDITQVVSATNKTPTTLRFSYLKGGVRQDLSISLTTGVATGLPVGYLYACAENATYNFGTAVVDVAYGKNGTYAYQTGVTGSITYNNARFGDPLVGVVKAGYYKPSYPFEVKTLASGKICLAIYPQRFAKFLASLQADTTAVNNSLVVNVDYTTATGSVWLTKPAIPCTDLDYGVILKECADMTSFTKGFSLVSNLRTYIGDDFNTTLYKNAVPAIPTPSGYTGSADTYYPPCSLFVPEKRYGVDTDPFAVNLGGQIGSLASDTDANPVRPMDSKTMSGSNLAANRISVNLRPITHPADLPPITMMNWLVVLEERKKEFVGY